MKSKIEVIEEEQRKKYTFFSNSWFKLKWNSETMQEFGKKVQSTLDKRKDWKTLLGNEIQKRMKFIPQKLTLDYGEIPYSETLEEFIAAFKEKVKLRETPIQKTISESVEVKPAPKKRGRPKKK